MRRLAFVLLVLAGCSYDGGRPPAVGDDEPPDASPGTPDAVPTQDSDGDGIDDAADNCVDVGNADQGNEDGDATGDACDLCPQLAAAQADGDGDHIGDGCDPRPTMAGDELLLFDGFNGTALATGWSIEAGVAAWTVSGGELAADVGDTAGILMRQVGAPGDRLLVETMANVSAVGPGTTRSIAVLADGQASPLAFDFCAVSFDSSDVELYRYEAGVWDPVESRTIATPMGVYTLRSRTTSGPMCTVDATQLDTMAGAGVGDHVGFRTRNATVRFAYIAVYRSP